MNLFKSNLLKIVGIIAIALFTVGCKKENMNIIPNVPVYIELDLVTDLAPLGVGQAVTIKPDTVNTEYSIVDYHSKKFPKTSIPWQTYNNGVLLYRPEFNKYLAFDMTCTYNPFVDDCSIQIVNLDFIPVCKCCKSVFNLVSGGFPMDSSKAKKALVQYNVTIVNGGTRLVISK